MKLLINQKQHTIDDSDSNRQLLWILRDRLGLVGTRFGCGVGICGACTVLIDDEVARSCIIPVTSVANGASIRTVEGLAQEGELHPIQQAFIDEQVPQCGWCMSGQMMIAIALLEKNTTPSDQEIDEAMTKNYCRCGCYSRLRRAVKRAINIIS